MLKGAIDFAIRAANANRAMYTACVLIFVAFAIAHIVAIIFPPKDGQSHKITKIVAGACVAALIASTVYFLVAANDAFSLLRKG